MEQAMSRLSLTAFVLGIMLGLLLQWPTILTLVMFPFLVFMCVHLGHAEDAKARRVFGDPCARYATGVPGWFPHLRRPETGHGLT